MTSTGSKTPRAAIYVRISRDKEGKEGAGLGVQRQEDDCRKKAAELGWAVEAIYPDNDTSAYSGKPRKAYERMLDDIRARRIEAVLCWHTDRLHRSPAELERYMNVVEAHGVLTETVKAGEMNLSTATGRMAARMFGNLARYEVEHMSERHRAANDQARAAGQRTGGKPAFGWRREGPPKSQGGTGRVVIHQAEADALRTCYQKLLAGETLNSICRWLNEAGFTTPRRPGGGGGLPWNGQRLRDTMLRASRAGLVEYDGQIVGPGEWPAIVPRDTWETARAILTDPKRRTSPGPKPRWLLTGHDGPLTCGVCRGTTFRSRVGVRSRNPENTARRHLYVCWPDVHVARDAERTDALVSAAVVEILARPESAGILRPSVDVTALNVRRGALRNQLNRLADAYDAGDIDLEGLTRASRSARQALDEIEAQLSSSPDGSVLDGIAGQEDAEAIWWSHTIMRRKAIVKATVKVTIMPTRPPRGMRPGATWFDPASVVIEPRW